MYIVLMNYNPKYDRNVVDNLRALAKEHNLSTEKFSDEEIYNLYMDGYFCEDTDAEFLKSLQEKSL